MFHAVSYTHLEQQLSGSLSAAVRKVREKLLHEIAFIESALDDPEHILSLIHIYRPLGNINHRFQIL